MVATLGSCTMKYNPMLNDWAAALPGFSNAHPQAPTEDVSKAPSPFCSKFKNGLRKLLACKGSRLNQSPELKASLWA